MEDSKKTITKSSKHFLFGTLFSRLTGMLRDITFAFLFGASIKLAAFMVAFRIALIFRTFFGEKLFLSGFVPHFEEIKNNFSSKKAFFFYRDLCYSIFSILLLLTLFFFLLKNFFSKKTIILFFYMFPSIIFAALYSINSAFLQCKKIYFIPAIAPIFFNITIIIISFLLKNNIYMISHFVILAFFMQWFFTFIFCFKIFIKNNSIKDFFTPNIFSYQLKRLIKPFSIGAIAISLTQINVCVDFILAKIKNPIFPSFLWYSSKLYHLPIALFAIAAFSAILPPFARSFSEKKLEKFKTFFDAEIKKFISLMITITFATIILGASSIAMIFARGKFNDFCVQNTFFCLLGYCLGFLPYSLILIISAALFSQKNYKIPNISSILCVFFNLILNILFLFVFKFKAHIISFATSLSLIFQLIFLIKTFNKNFLILEKDFHNKKSYLLKKSFLNTFFTSLMCNVATSILVFCIGYFILKDPSLHLLLQKKVIFPKNIFFQLKSFFTLAALYLSFLIIFATLFKEKEILNIFKQYVPKIHKLKVR